MPRFGTPSVATIRSKSALQIEQVHFAGAAMLGKEEALRDWLLYLQPFQTIESADFEVFSVHASPNASEPIRISSAVHYTLCGKGTGGERRQHSGDWSCEWIAHASAPLLTAWSFDLERRSTLHGPGFREITHSCIAQDSSAAGQLNAGTDYWRTILDGAIGVDVYGNNGIAVGDIDGSGRDSFYVCQPKGLPNRLFHNRGDGTFEDITETSGTGLLDGTASAIFADFENRGVQDLLVVRSGGPLLFRNLGNGRFEQRTNAFHFREEPKGTFTSAAVGDYDRDGRLDIYLCVYSYYQGLNQYSFPTPYYDAQNGPPNFLFRNRGDGTFEDVTAAAGMNANNDRFSFAAEWVDLRGDGYPDLYVANDFGRKNFYRNHGNGTFTDDAGAAGVEDYGPGMSINTLDTTGNGRLDLYVANMWLAEGKRITEQPAFLPDVPESIRALYRKHNAGNSLYRNLGNGSFESVGERSGVQRGGWSWSCASWDPLHEGHADLYVANGFVSGTLRPDLQSFFWRQVAQKSIGAANRSGEYELAWNAVNELVRSDYSWSGHQRNAFFLNDGAGSFTDVAGILGLDLVDDSRAFALTDIDGDGRLEILLKNRTGPQLKILRNDLEGIGQAVAIRLRGSQSNRDAIGAVVTVEVDGQRQTRQLSAGSGFASQHSKELFFGTGAAARSITLFVRWPSGATGTWHGLQPGTRTLVTEGVEQFSAEPFRSGSKVMTPDSAAGTEAGAVTTASTWLFEPLVGPPLRSAGQDAVDVLTLYRGRRVAVVLFDFACAEYEGWIARMVQQRMQAEKAGVFLCLVTPESASGEPARTFASAHGVPIVPCNSRSLQAWSIQLRYLFDRRRDLEFPTVLLFAEDGKLVRVHRGAVDPAVLLEDARRLQKPAESIQARALPFPGRFYGPAPMRDSFTFGVAFVQYGFLDEAQSAFQQTLEQRPDYAAAWFNLGTIYLNQKSYVDAERCLLQATRLGPEDSDAWNNLGLVEGEQGRYDAALQAFQKAALANPANNLPVENMMRIYQFQNRPADAQAALQQLLDVAPNRPELHLAMGMSRLAQGDEARGKAELERAIELRPNYTDALNDLGTWYMRNGDTTAALQLFERCRKADPDFDRAVLNEAVLYRRISETDKARSLLQDFLQKHPDNADVSGLLQRLGGA